jgi:hypothetical protein
MTALAPAPEWRLRRIAAVPRPFADESFGSWLGRLAAAHHVGREAFVEALLSEAPAGGAVGHPRGRRIRFDSDPPPGLVDALSARTGVSRDEFVALLAPRSTSRLRDDEPEQYCPACWREDASQGARRIRRAWRERWTVVCEQHQARLRTSRLPLERLLYRGDRNPRWVRDLYEAMFPQSLCTSLVHVQRLAQAAEQGGILSDEVRDRARVLRDLALFAGAQFGDGSLVEWSVDLERGGDRKLYWCDARGRALKNSVVREPRASLEVRQLALRLAMLIVGRLFDAPASTRPEDLAIWAGLNLMERQCDRAEACDRMLRSWPDGYQALWELAFGWPGQGGSVQFKRRFRHSHEAAEARETSSTTST